MTGFLFDVARSSIAQESEARPVSIGPADAVAFASVHPALRPDVLRVIVHKTGRPNPVLGGENGAPTGREFWLVQLRDGSYVWHYTDNDARGPATGATTDWLVDQMLGTGDWREVRG